MCCLALEAMLDCTASAIARSCRTSPVYNPCKAVGGLKDMHTQLLQGLREVAQRGPGPAGGGDYSVISKSGAKYQRQPGVQATATRPPGAISNIASVFCAPSFLSSPVTNIQCTTLTRGHPFALHALDSHTLSPLTSTRCRQQLTAQLSSHCYGAAPSIPCPAPSARSGSPVHSTAHSDPSTARSPRLVRTKHTCMHKAIASAGWGGQAP